MTTSTDRHHVAKLLTLRQAAKLAGVTHGAAGRVTRYRVGWLFKPARRRVEA